MRISLLWLAPFVLASCGALPSRPATEVERPAVAARDPAAQARDRSQPKRLVATQDGLCHAASDGRVRCWGEGWHYDYRPHAIEGLSHVVELVASDGPGEPICARRANGSVACFTPPETSAGWMVEIDIDDAVDLAVRNDEMCAVRDNGRIECWGGPYSESGWHDDERVETLSAEEWAATTAREGITDAIALRAAAWDDEGGWCALRRSGRVSCWGSGLPGEPDLEEPPSTFEIAGIEDAVDLALGPGACVLERSGRVLCTGELDATTEQDGWTVVPRIEGIVELEWRGRAHGSECGRDAAGALRCWAPPNPVFVGPAVELGDPELGAYLEREGELQRTGRVPEELETAADEITRWESGGCASLREGGVRCWGDAYDGLGRHDVVAAPQRVELASVVAIDAFDDVTCAIDERNHVHCWGEPIRTGMLGTNEALPRVSPTPRHVPELDGAVEIRLELQSVCIRTRHGEVRCRGELARSSVGEGWPIEPTRTIPSLRGARTIALRRDTVCGVVGARVRCHTRRRDRVEEDDGLHLRLIERDIAIAELEGAIEVRPGPLDWVARTEDGRVALFNPHQDQPRAQWVSTTAPGPLGMLAAMSLCTPREGSSCSAPPWASYAEELDDIGALTHVSVAAHHACGVRDDGRVVCWGLNSHGEVGREAIVQHHPPQVVEGIHDVRAVVAAAQHTCALTTDGEVFCWGRDNLGRLGVTLRRPAPARVRAVPQVD